MYLTATIPDIMHNVSVISRYMECPTEIHLLAAKKKKGTCKVLRNLGCSTRRDKSQICLNLQIMIMQEIQMIEKAHRGMFS